MPRWLPTSPKHLEEAEDKVLSSVKVPIEKYFVEIFDGFQIRTYKIISTNGNSSKSPLVLIHGFAAGAGFWSLNFDELSQEQDVYAIDLLGFGRSSRPKFPNDQDEIENMFVSSIESWRKAVGIVDMVLLGHSFGGYLSVLYSLAYPNRVVHLILADPWGFPERDVLENYFSKWKLCVFTALASTLNPLAILRAFGPYGPSLVSRLRPDIKERYERLYGDGDTRVTDYIYHCNAQEPSGEIAFFTISSIGFANRPLNQRIHAMSPQVPITILYGSNSWIIQFYNFNFVRSILKDSYIKIYEIKDASHHLYADQVDEFNRLVIKACNRVRTKMESMKVTQV
ncbi:1-acylglycerol-3-phosphate O-acyltransferase ABHD5 isoform X2 [Hydra vulgaris]|uniref:1-acylglycerol-3-phosphate O-acyltransferase ABHD5 isoform X2 n=1 Tax=Hydra vulgaris TaxID=6087 RepID=A0ABM4DPR7_HYDVU